MISSVISAALSRTTSAQVDQTTTGTARPRERRSDPLVTSSLTSGIVAPSRLWFKGCLPADGHMIHHPHACGTDIPFDDIHQSERSAVPPLGGVCRPPLEGGTCSIDTS